MRTHNVQSSGSERGSVGQFNTSNCLVRFAQHNSASDSGDNDLDEGGRETTKPETETPWLDVKAAGAYVGFCEKTIRRACATGGLEHVRMGRSIRIQREWLDDWLMAENREAA